MIPGATLYLPLEDLVDFEKEKERLLKEQARLEKELARSKGMLSNEKFLKQSTGSKSAGREGQTCRIRTDDGAGQRTFGNR